MKRQLRQGADQLRAVVPTLSDNACMQTAVSVLPRPAVSTIRPHRDTKLCVLFALFSLQLSQLAARFGALPGALSDRFLLLRKVAFEAGSTHNVQATISHACTR